MRSVPANRVDGARIAPYQVREAVHEIVTVMAPSRHGAVTDDRHLIADLGYDSLRLIELAVVVERRFGLPPLNLDRALAVSTVRDLVGLVTQLLAQADG